jgi:hypothetical protein
MTSQPKCVHTISSRKMGWNCLHFKKSTDYHASPDDRYSRHRSSERSFDVGANEDFIKRVLMGVGTRNRLSLWTCLWRLLRLGNRLVRSLAASNLGLTTSSEILITIHRDPTSFLLNSNTCYIPVLIYPAAASLVIKVDSHNLRIGTYSVN